MDKLTVDYRISQLFKLTQFMGVAMNALWWWLCGLSLVGLTITGGCDSTHHNFVRNMEDGSAANVPHHQIFVPESGSDFAEFQVTPNFLDNPYSFRFAPCINEEIPHSAQDGVAMRTEGENATCFSVKIGSVDSDIQMSPAEFYITPTYYAADDEYDVQVWWNPVVTADDHAHPASGDLAELPIDNNIGYYYQIKQLEDRYSAQYYPVYSWRSLGMNTEQLDRDELRFSSGTTSVLTIQMVRRTQVDSPPPATFDLAEDQVLATATLWLQYNQEKSSFFYSTSENSGEMAESFTQVNDRVGDDPQVEIMDWYMTQAAELPDPTHDQSTDEDEFVVNPSPEPSQPMRFYTQVSTDTLTISWDKTPPELEDLGVVDFEFKLDGAPAWTPMGLESPFVIEDLIPGQAYRLQLRSVYSYDLPKQVSKVSTVQLSTLSTSMREQSPSSQQLVFSLHPKTHAVEVNWQAPRVFDATKIRDYQYQIVQPGSPWRSMGLSGFYEITQLEPAQIYVLKFRVIYPEGPSGVVTATVKTLSR